MKTGLLRNLINRFKNVEPVRMMLGGIALVVILVFAFKLISAPKSNLTIVYDDLPPTSEIIQKRKVKEDAQLGETDSNMRLSARVLEANGIANSLLNLCLYQHFVNKNGVPGTTDDLMTSFLSSEIKPPFVLTITPNGQIVTERGVYFVSYNPRPLMIRVLAGGAESRRDGAVFALRVPDDAASFIADKDKIKAADAAALYVAPERSDAIVPAAFAPAQDYLNAGWTIEPLRLSDVTPEKLDSINRLLNRSEEK